MAETANIDLSKLKIQREEDSSHSPAPKRIRTVILVGMAIAAVALLIVVLQSSLSRAIQVDVAAVSYIYPSQANAVLTASGYVVAQRKAAIASKATGRLVYLGVEEGDNVRKGQIIARIESADMEAALAQAQATLAQYKAELTDAERSYDRAKQLIAAGLISQAEYDAAKSRYERVIASVAAADAAVKAAEVQVENTRIRAPFDGTILTKNADVGEVVAPFGAGASAKVAVVTIADMSSLEVEADVSESNIERVTVGQPCEIVLDAYPDKRYRGYVHKIVPTADRAKATVLTKIRFSELDSRVLPEMSAKVQFLSKRSDEDESTTPVLGIPASAIVARGGKTVAFRVIDNSVTEVPVEVGRQIGNSVEILQGLSLNDKVVVRPGGDLSTGTRVSVRK
jgi:RND family efflux transporter MFP subunit